MNRCPSADQLRLLLADELTDPDASAVEAHATRCPRCQEVLEQLAGASADLNAQRPAQEPATERHVKQEDDAAFFRKLQQAPPWNASPPQPAADGRLPELPGYAVLDKLGAGGMGVVYQARDLRLNRLVAVKMIHAGAHARPQDRLRFQIEAEAVAALQHPNIVQIHEVGEADGCPYLVLEYVAGGSLAQRMRAQPLAFREAAELVRTLALAVDHAHCAGIIHRDLKPANVLLTADGQPKITDFGLAKRLGTEGGQTATGEVFGTPSYMAPEQTRGDRQQIGTAADVYALGAILYDLLTGRPPFQADTPLATMLLVANEEPKRPSQLGVQLPRDLETICLKCLEKEPGRRYASPLALAEDLQRFRQGEPIVARPVGTLERAGKWVRRRPLAAALIGVSALAALALVGLGVGLWYSGRLETALQLVEQQRTEAEKFKEQIRYAREMQLAHQAWHDGQTARVVALLEGWRPTDADQPDRRGWEWYYLHGLCNKGDRTLSAGGDGLVSMAWSPDGRWLVAGGMTTGHDYTAPVSVHVWDARRWEKVRTLSGHRGVIAALAFHRDGRLLASGGREKTVRLWDLDRWEEVGVLLQPDLVNALAFSPDGRLLAAAGSGRSILLWDTSSRQTVGTLQGKKESINDLAFSPDGRLLASCSGNESTVSIWDVAGKRLLHTLKGHTSRISSLAFSPDGRWLASASADATVRLWDTVTWQEQIVCKGHQGAIFRVAFSPDGRRLASSGRDGTVRLWDAASGKEVHLFRGHLRGLVYGVAFSPDGLWLTSADFEGTVKVWDLTDGQQDARLLAGHEDTILNVAVSPDGRRLASASSDKTVRLWDLPGGGRLQVLAHDDAVLAAAFSPDGRHLASAGRHSTTIQLWDAAKGTRLRTYEGHTNAVRNLAFSTDGRWLASAGFDHTVKVWDVAGGQTLATLEGHTHDVCDVVFSRDGRWLASAASEATVRLWDTAHWQPVTTFLGHKGIVNRVAFSANGRWLAAAGAEGMVLVWDVASRERRFSLPGHWGHVQGLAFSPDSQRLATGGEDRTVRLWDLDSGQELLRLRGHTASVWSLAFSPDGRWLISAGAEETKQGLIRLWDGRPDKGQK